MTATAGKSFNCSGAADMNDPINRHEDAKNENEGFSEGFWDYAELRPLLLTDIDGAVSDLKLLLLVPSLSEEHKNAIRAVLQKLSTEISYNAKGTLPACCFIRRLR